MGQRKVFQKAAHTLKRGYPLFKIAFVVALFTIFREQPLLSLYNNWENLGQRSKRERDCGGTRRDSVKSSLCVCVLVWWWQYVRMGFCQRERGDGQDPGLVGPRGRQTGKGQGNLVHNGRVCGGFESICSHPSVFSHPQKKKEAEGRIILRLETQTEYVINCFGQQAKIQISYVMQHPVRPQWNEEIKHISRDK